MDRQDKISDQDGPGSLQLFFRKRERLERLKKVDPFALDVGKIDARVKKLGEARAKKERDELDKERRAKRAVREKFDDYMRRRSEQGDGARMWATSDSYRSSGKRLAKTKSTSSLKSASRVGDSPSKADLLTRSPSGFALRQRKNSSTMRKQSLVGFGRSMGEQTSSRTKSRIEEAKQRDQSFEFHCATPLGGSHRAQNGDAQVIQQQQDNNDDNKFYVLAKYRYDAQEALDLGFTKGDVIKVLRQSSDGEGWWYGKNITKGGRGYFPSNFVEQVPDPVNTEQDAAACKIQSQVRRRLAKKRVKIHPPSLQEEDQAAIKIQAKFRGKVSSDKYKQQTHAAVRIQHFTRKEVHAKACSNRENLAATKIQNSFRVQAQKKHQKEQQAVVRIQKVTRGRIARRKSVEIKSTYNAAAEKIQRSYRRRRASCHQGQAAQPRVQSQERKLVQEVEEPIDLDNEDVKVAATKIQAVRRGQLARRNKTEAHHARPVVKTTPFKAGDTVEAKYKDSSLWFTAEIVNVNLDGSINLKFTDNDELATNVPSEQVRFPLERQSSFNLERSGSSSSLVKQSSRTNLLEATFSPKKERSFSTAPPNLERTNSDIEFEFGSFDREESELDIASIPLAPNPTSIARRDTCPANIVVQGQVQPKRHKDTYVLDIETPNAQLIKRRGTGLPTKEELQKLIHFADDDSDEDEEDGVDGGTSSFLDPIPPMPDLPVLDRNFTQAMRNSFSGIDDAMNKLVKK